MPQNTRAQPLLRLTQLPAGPGQHQVLISLDAPGQNRRTAVSSFSFDYPEPLQREVSWYLEDYLQFPYDPAPQMAARVERETAELGRKLFRAIFGSEDARDLWASFRPILPESRIEVATGVEEAVAIPWELLREPRTDQVLALGCSAFVRGYSNAAAQPRLPVGEAGPVRILLVISRPMGEEGWQGNLPRRIHRPPMPMPMPMTDRLLLARALAEKRGHGPRVGALLKPLLRYSRGNPLTITVLVGQTLRQGLTSRAQVERRLPKRLVGRGVKWGWNGRGRSC